VARDVNAQRHTNTLRSHPLDRLYFDFTLVCSPEECGCYRVLLPCWYYYRCYYDAVTAAAAAATTTTIAIRG